MRAFLVSILIFFITVCVAFSDPWISTPTTTTETTSYQLIVDTRTPMTFLAHKNADGTYMGAFDIDTLNPPLSNGIHNLTIQGFNSLWGLSTNIHPFVVSKPAELDVISVVNTTKSDPRQ